MIENTSHLETEARKYFGQDFINAFDALLNYLNSKNVYLFVHGADDWKVESIQETGLLSEEPNIFFTADLEKAIAGHYQRYHRLYDWPHNHRKHLALLGIPKICLTKSDNEVQPLWEDLRDENNPSVYNLRPEFVLGLIDVNERTIFLNNLYREQHTFEGLVIDERVFDLEDPKCSKNLGYEK